MRGLIFLSVLVACGQDRMERIPAPDIPPRVRLLTDAQYANAVRDLLGLEALAVHTPGTDPHQLVHEDLVAVDGAALVEYRMAAEQAARQATGCADLDCSLKLAERAFRRPLQSDEIERLRGVFELGGFPLVVETVLQAPSFLYRTELTGTLSQYELAAELAFFFYDSLPDDGLWAAAQSGKLANRDTLALEVDRLLGESRVQGHLVDVVLDWFEIHRVLDAPKDGELYPEFTTELRESMYAETQLFVRDLMWRRHGSLRELLTAQSTFADAQLAAHYGGAQRAGILTQGSVLAALATPARESIILRGVFVHRNLLCTPELGRPPFSTIADLAGFTGKLSESQFAHYRAANTYCSTCHRIIDPPGRALEHYDSIGRWRDTDELGIAVEDDTTFEIDGHRVDVRGGIELGRALADSDQVARCAVQRLTEHAFGRKLDRANIDYVLFKFEEADRELVQLFRAIALSPAFRERRVEEP